MSPDEAKEFVRRVFEPIEAGRFEEYGKAAAPGFVSHGPRGDMNLEGMKKRYTAVRIGFPDWHLKVEDAFSCDDRLAMRGTFRSTRKGTSLEKAAIGKLIT